MGKAPEKDRRERERIFPGAKKIEGFVGFVRECQKVESRIPRDLAGLAWFVEVCEEVIGRFERDKLGWQPETAFLRLKIGEALKRVEEIEKLINQKANQNPTP